MNIKAKCVNGSSKLPARKSLDAVGMDLQAAMPTQIGPGQWELVPCGFAIEIPRGFEGQIRPRSGLAFTKGVTVLNAPGTIDPDYRGEVKVLLVNHGKKTAHIQREERIAQLVICPVSMAELEKVEELSDTERGEGGFGSTGSK